MTRHSPSNTPTPRRTTRSGGLLLVGGVVAVLLTGCGSGPADSGSEQGAAADPTASASATETPSSSPTDGGPAAGADPNASEVPMPGAAETALVGAPACADVWVAGRTLPAKYRGCVEGGTDKVAEIVPCESGQQIVTFGDSFWAVRGSEVKQVSSLSSDSGYRDAMTTCGA